MELLGKWFMVKSTKKNTKRALQRKTNILIKKLYCSFYSFVDNVLVTFKKLYVHSQIPEKKSFTLYGLKSFWKNDSL